MQFVMSESQLNIDHNGLGVLISKTNGFLQKMVPVLLIRRIFHAEHDSPTPGHLAGRSMYEPMRNGFL